MNQYDKKIVDNLTMLESFLRAMHIRTIVELQDRDLHLSKIKESKQLLAISRYKGGEQAYLFDSQKELKQAIDCQNFQKI